MELLMIVTLLIGLVIFALIWWAATRLMAAFGIGEPIHTVVMVVLVVLFVLWLLGIAGLVARVF